MPKGKLLLLVKCQVGSPLTLGAPPSQPPFTSTPLRGLLPEAQRATETEEHWSLGPALLGNHLHSVQQICIKLEPRTFGWVSRPHSFPMLLWPPLFITIYKGGRATETPNWNQHKIEALPHIALKISVLWGKRVKEL